MSTTMKERRKKEHDREWQTNFTYYIQRGYQAGQGATLSTLDLEEGDALPDDSDYEIVRSNIVRDKDGGRVAMVIAIKEVTE